jgi:hypothetical protein
MEVPNANPLSSAVKKRREGELLAKQQGRPRELLAKQQRETQLLARSELLKTGCPS